MDAKTQERYAKAMQRFINEVEEKIEGKVEDWLNENPYWEFDDEDEHGHRVFRCPPTRSSDAREALSEDFIVSGEEVEHKNCTDFFEFVINEIYGFPMGSLTKADYDGSAGIQYISSYRLPVGITKKSQIYRVRKPRNQF